MNFGTLDLNLLKIFDALFRERSVTRAGERIGLSQPAVSAALNRLRHASGDQLFIRHGHDMIPTPRAESLAAPIRAALEQLEKALGEDKRFDPGQAERVFTLLGADFFSSLLIPRLAARFERIAPRIQLRFLDSARGDVERLLREDLIDLALERPLELPEWISRQVLFESPFVIIAARKNKTIAKEGIKPGARLPLGLFLQLPHAIRSIDGSLRGLVDDALERKGHSRRVMLAVPHFHGLAAAVAQTGMIAAVPVQFADAVARDAGLAIYQAPFDIPVPKIQIYWHKRHDRNPGHVWLRQQISALNSYGREA